MAIDAGQDDRGRLARRLMRQAGRTALGTSFAGRPYVSLVACACDTDASPLLLLSDLAQHSRNLAADPRVSLLFEDPAAEDQADPLAGARLTVLGEAVRHADPGAIARFAACHPASAAYAGFADFHLYRVVVERGHLVAGFGRIAWVDAAALRSAGDAAPLAAAAADIIAHMNTDHADTVALYAARLAGRSEIGWQLGGIDPDGIDLRRDGERARIDFPVPVLTPAAARQALIALAERARNTPPRR
ncbi:MAG TPA: DUF2470 domain-containing protein [Stellaceae bacterium]|jgi:hypothetical protein|nr:DUF2470 domain-containing protein [Stellaceae bacterium]